MARLGGNACAGSFSGRRRGWPSPSEGIAPSRRYRAVRQSFGWVREPGLATRVQDLPRGAKGDIARQSRSVGTSRDSRGVTRGTGEWDDRPIGRPVPTARRRALARSLALLSQLRDEAPGLLADHESHGEFWVLSRFDDVFEAVRDTGTYSWAQGRRPDADAMAIFEGHAAPS